MEETSVKETKTESVQKRSGSSKNINMTSGNIIPSLIRFIIPLILTGFLQQFYNTADNIVVGNFGGKEALASVGVNASIISLTISVFLSVFTGTNILVARAKGANDAIRLQRIVSTTYIVALGLGFSILIIGQCLAGHMLTLIECPENIRESAEIYLRIYICGAPASVFNNFAAAVLRSTGNSRSPFIYLTISGALNVVLNLILVITLSDPVVSVGLATVISMYAATALFAWHLIRSSEAIKLYPFRLSFDTTVFAQTFRFGIPSAISSATFSLTNLIIAPALNSYGDVGISGNAASGSLESFLYAVTGSFSVATSAFVGQNIGAGNKERVARVIKTNYIVVVVIMSIYTAINLIFCKQLLNLFIPGESEAIAFAQFKINFIVGAAVINGIMNVNGGALQAYGYTSLQMLSNLIGVCLFRIIWMIFVYPQNPTPTTLFSCYPISWAFTAITLFIVVNVMTKRYVTGRLEIKSLKLKD